MDKIKKLSMQEHCVVYLMSLGHKNKMIAAIIGINEKTVSTYVSRIKTKLCVDSSKNIYILITKAKALGYLKAMPVGSFMETFDPLTEA